MISNNNAVVWGKLDPEDNYLISIDGQVKSTWYGKERQLKLFVHTGYLGFNYCKDGKKTLLHVHRCVAKVFLGDRTSEGLGALHKDGNQLNNNVENLYWGTQKQNREDMIRHGTMPTKLKEADIYKIRELRSTGMLQREIADFFGVSQTLIGMILRGEIWTHLANA